MTESVTFCLTNLLLCVSLYIDNEIGFVMTKIFVKKESPEPALNNLNFEIFISQKSLKIFYFEFYFREAQIFKSLASYEVSKRNIWGKKTSDDPFQVCNIKLHEESTYG